VAVTQLLHAKSLQSACKERANAKDRRHWPDNGDVAKSVLASPFGSISGRIGNLVVINYRDGRSAVRERVVPRNPRTPAQTAARERLALVQAAWSALSPPQIETWDAYARLVNRSLPATVRATSARNLFIALGTKVLQMDFTSAIPRSAPTDLFAGDSIPVITEAAGGQVVFSSEGQNGEGVATELLLASVAAYTSRPPLRAYRTKGFHQFAAGAPTFTVSVQPGWYAPAIRFVRVATGQVSDVLPMGNIRVV
jgi:hypothetical protein